MEKELAKNLSEFIFQTNYQELPKEVVHQAKRCILDFLGVVLAGSGVGLAPLITDIISNLGGKGEATTIGDGKKLPALNVALINAVRGHALDMDDGHRHANGHPGVVTIPAALALAERENITGKEVIEAIVAGYETFIRVGISINPSHLKRGFHTTGTIGPFGAASACSKILGLSKKEIKNALAIAGLQGAGLLEVMASGQIMKPFHPGKAVQGGLLASLLAKEGAEGPDLIFEGENGFLKAFSDVRDLSKILYGLGSHFEIMNIYFKLHAACRHIHPALDATIEIMSRNEINVREIKRINVHTYSTAYLLTGQKKEVNTELAAKFSLPFSIALLLVYGKAGTDEYSLEHIKNPSVRDLAEKVNIVVDKERDDFYPDKRGASVSIETLKDVYTHDLDIPKGEPEFPFSDDELKNKFFQNVKNVFSAERITQIQKAIFHMENKPIRELMELVY